MNVLEIARLVCNNHRVAISDSHRLQAVRLYINMAQQEVLSAKTEWAFLRKTARILTEADEDNYALPYDAVSITAADIDGGALVAINPDNYYKFIRQYTTSASISDTVFTILGLTESPFANQGYVLPVFGAKAILGVGTAFDTRVVGRYFKAERDAQSYRIRSYTDSKNIELSQKFAGKSQGGTINIYSDALDRVVGNVHVTNFTENMIGHRMQIGSATATDIIQSVDELRQVIMLTADSNNGEGTDLSFSIQDNYEIDPAGVQVLKIYPVPTEDDLVITIDYMAGHTDLMGNYATPIIPQRWHAILVHKATMLYGLMENSDAADISWHSKAYEQLLFNMMGTDDPLSEMYPFSVQPDPVRHEALTDDID